MNDVTNPKSEATTTEPVRPMLTPAVDVFEDAHEYRLVADLPGVKREDLSLDLERGELTLLARRSAAREGERLVSGRIDAEYRRVFRLPDTVDANAIEATLEGGVLQVRLPKADGIKPRRISIKAVA